MPASDMQAPARFADVEGRIALYLRALWGRGIRLRPFPAPAAAEPRCSLDGSTLRMPAAFPSVRLYRAAAAHAAAHVVFTAQRFPVGTLKPVQVALVSLIEDARVEHLAMRELPGLRALWQPFHVARAGGAETAGALMARLARALIDEDYEDDNPWVARARRLFFEQQDYWHEQSISRTLGGLLGNDLGQMRVQFNFKTYVVEPAYRDDNQGIWDFGEGARGEDEEVAMQGARLADRHAGAADGEDERAEPPAGEEERVKPVAASAQKEDLHDEPLSPPIRYDEWDYLIGQARPAWCTLVEKPSPEGDPRAAAAILARHAELVARLQRLVKAVQVERPVVRRKRLEGDRLDLDACIDAMIDARSGLPPDPRVHALRTRGARDLSVLVLLDLSQSTADAVPGGPATVLDLAREATVLLAQAMEGIGDAFAIHGFSSNGRSDVSYYRFKDFEAPYGELSRARLSGMAPLLSTRMGTALRHAATFLHARRAHRKLVLLVTDGEPSDIDVHDPLYLVHDAKKAVEENHRRGIFTYCMSLDGNADRYVSRIFGARNYMVVDRIGRLPEKMPLAYLRLTR